MISPEHIFKNGNYNLKDNKPEEKEPSILDSLENQLLLAQKLKGVYNKRPILKSFEGAMKGTKYESEYTPEAIANDEAYVKKVQERIYEDNSSAGQERLDYLEGGCQLSEILQAMIVDQVNKNWFQKCKAIMTSIFDDLKAKIDAIIKHDRGGYLGMSFDFTIASKEKILYNKLKREWENYTKDGKVQTIKYYQDPDTGEKGKLLVPKFIIGASKKDVEELAQAYLNNDQETLKNHPFKYLMLLQIEEQLQTALDYYETSEVAPGYYEVDNQEKNFKFARTQYEHIQTLLRRIKTEINFDKKTHETIDLFEYIKNSVALNMMRRFRMMHGHKID